MAVTELLQILLFCLQMVAAFKDISQFILSCNSGSALIPALGINVQTPANWTLFPQPQESEGLTLCTPW